MLLKIQTGLSIFFTGIFSIIPTISYSQTANIQVQGAYLLGVEIFYTLENGENEFCYLAQNTVGNRSNNEPISGYRFPFNESTFPFVENTSMPPFGPGVFFELPGEQTTFVVHSLLPLQTFSGSLRIYDEGSLPPGEEILVQLFVRGFDCASLSRLDRERAFYSNEIGSQTYAPKSVGADDLLEISSDMFVVDFRRR